MAKLGNLTYTANLSFENNATYKYTQSNHDCEFDIQRGIETAGNIATIKIKNIPYTEYTEFYSPAMFYTDRIRGIMKFAIGRRGIGEYIVFEKDIFTIETDKIGQTTIVQFNCMAGAFALKSVRSVYSQKMTLQEFLKKLANENNLKIGTIDVDNTKYYNFSFPEMSLMEIISHIKSEFKIDIYIDNNKLNAFSNSSGKLIVTAGYVITSEQLIGTPKLTEKGIKLTIHFDPRFEILQSVTLNSKLAPKLNGNYMVRSVRHYGNINYTDSSFVKTDIELLYFKI